MNNVQESLPGPLYPSSESPIFPSSISVAALDTRTRKSDTSTRREMEENETSNTKTDQINSDNLNRNQISEQPEPEPQPVKPRVPSPRITVSKTGKNAPAQNPPTQNPTNVTEVKVGNRKMKLVQNFHKTRPFRDQRGSITRLNAPMKINPPSPPNGPPPSHIGGKRVIGTRIFGGQKQLVTTERTVGNNAASIHQAVRMVVTSKMVGRKEVQLVTPNMGANNKGTIRFVRREPVGTGTSLKATVTISKALAKSNFRPTGTTSSNQAVVSGPSQIKPDNLKQNQKPNCVENQISEKPEPARQPVKPLVTSPRITDSKTDKKPPAQNPPVTHQPNEQQMMPQTQEPPPTNLQDYKSWVVKKYAWVEICDGKLFCKVDF